MLKILNLFDLVNGSGKVMVGRGFFLFSRNFENKVILRKERAIL